jgi:hypothetical protein
MLWLSRGMQFLMTRWLWKNVKWNFGALNRFTSAALLRIYWVKLLKHYGSGFFLGGGQNFEMGTFKTCSRRVTLSTMIICISTRFYCRMNVLKIDAFSTRQCWLRVSDMCVEVPKINKNSNCIWVLTVETWPHVCWNNKQENKLN